MIMLLHNWYLRHFSEPGTIEFAIVLVCSFLTVYYLMWLVGPLVVSLCIAYCLDWLVRLLNHKLKLSRMCSSVITMALFVGVSVGILVFVVPKVLQQGNQFYLNLQKISTETVNSDNGEDFDSNIAARINEFVATMPEPIPSMVSEDELKNMVVNARSVIIANTTNIIKNQVMPSVVNTLSWLMYMIIVPIFVFLMLANKPVLQKRIRTYILPNNQALIHEFWPQINAQIEGYIRGKLLHITIIAFVNSLAFMFLGLNYALLLGVGVGLSVVIPYVGAVIITIPVLLVSIFQFGMSTTLIWVCVVYIVIQILDSNVLTPLLFSKAMNLDAFSILSAILIFGGLWGFWGVFFSIPLATFIRTLIVNWPSTDEKGHRVVSQN
uniref:AI-2E family transporter n=1 Tax=Succinivibrio sp. TaxID=2053619 RepID=UPI00402A9C03